MFDRCEKWFFQKEEGLVKGQLNHSDLRQYINQMKNQITELKNEVGAMFNAFETHLIRDLFCQTEF